MLLQLHWEAAGSGAASSYVVSLKGSMGSLRLRASDHFRTPLSLYGEPRPRVSGKPGITGLLMKLPWSEAASRSQ